MSKNNSSTASSQKNCFDVTTKLMIDKLKREVTDAKNKKSVAQTVVLALTARQTAAQGLLTRAQTSAASAEQTFHDGQVVTQTVLNGYVHAMAAQERAKEIRDAIRTLYEDAYACALKAVDSSQAVEDFVLGVKSYKAKNEYFSSDVAAAMPDVLLKAQTALAAALNAVQVSMLALAAAEEAFLSTETVVREALRLLEHLLRMKKIPDKYATEPVTNLRTTGVQLPSPPPFSRPKGGLGTQKGRGWRISLRK